MTTDEKPAPPAWELKPGRTITRKLLQDTFGGRTQGGIGPSKRSPNVFVFSDPPSGEKHGYIDTWMPDHRFHYTGEGQRGDQRMVSGNLSILRHKEEGRALRVFNGARGEVTYVDEFEVDSDQPYYETDAPETGGGPVRKVIVFRLRPKTITSPPSQSRFAEVLRGKSVEAIPVESHLTERFFVEPARAEYEAERREATLVHGLAAHLRADGHKVYRHRLVPTGELKPLFTDLFDATTKVLVEGKGVATREAVRMAIGQLADYARLIDASTRAILLPSRPRPDLEALGHSQDIAFIWPSGGGFAASHEGIV